jgi:two-component system NtrC family response regulator
MKIAIVEDDINMRKSLEIALGEYEEFSIVSFKNAKDALKKIDDSFELVITDITMPGIDGIEFLNELGGKLEAIVITGNATVNRAIEALRLGVKDFITKPFEIDTLVKAIKRSQKIQKVTKASTNNVSSSNSDVKTGFIGHSKSLEKVLKVANKSAVTDVTIMLLGESGVGKEVFANYIHNNSNRVKKPFVAINMAAIPDNLLESELFGYEKGAFTDASEARAGKFEVANGGTLFLDEIAEMPMPLQAKILRVLQEREVTRLGSSKPTKIDVRIVSATNANLLDKIDNKEFREDLYFRLNTIPIHIPPLRERVEEVESISAWVLSETCKKYNFDEKSFSKEAKDRLLSYNWPGNIRELISVVERAVILSENDSISEDDLFLESRVSSIDSLEKKLIKEVLNSCQNDIVEASEILGMNQNILNKKIKKYNLLSH